REVTVAVRVTGPRHRPSDWSNLATLKVVPPVARPANLQVKATAKGVELTWQSPETLFKVFRQGPDDKAPQPLSTAEKPEYTDPSAQYGKTYAYSVQAIHGVAQSEIATAPPITPADTFPPEVPSGLTGVAGAGSVQLAWERNLEADFKGYSIYRSADDGPFVKVGETNTPTYSDTTVQPGKHYRYTVSAIDQSGNESAQCAPQEVTPQ
ncbi:MAG: fibronectin type III domain-containing protein, partial [Bryobacteraceae bacterium]